MILSEFTSPSFDEDYDWFVAVTIIGLIILVSLVSVLTSVFHRNCKVERTAASDQARSVEASARIIRTLSMTLFTALGIKWQLAMMETGRGTGKHTTASGCMSYMPKI